MIEIVNLVKKYNEQIAVDNLNLKIKEGEIFCLLGANGAGKSTTINILLNFINPTSGTVKINNIDVTIHGLESKKFIAYIPEQVNLYNNFSGIENLKYFSELSGKKYSNKELQELLLRVGLDSLHFDKKVGAYSKGMRQKIGIAMAIAKEAKVLLLDEPTSGLDPKSSLEFSLLLKELSDKGTSVLMATHDLFRTKEMNSSVGIMKQGKLLTSFKSEEFNHSDIEKIYMEYIG